MNKSKQKKLNKLLFSALDENNEKKIIELVNKGANVNAKDRSGDSILMMAVYYGSPKLVNFLIEKGADVNYIFYDENYGLHENSNAIKSAYYAGKTGRMDLVKLLLEKADINLQDKDGGTLLMWAAKRGYTNMLKILLQKGAKLDIKDRIGWNALEWACWSGEREAVKLLREAGAKWVCIFGGN